MSRSERTTKTSISTLVKCVGAGFKTRIGAMILMAASVAFPSTAIAVEGGGSNWAMGAAGFGAGVIPEPGFHYANLS